MSGIDPAAKLRLYNNALLDVGERALASLDENREPRRLLDLAWDSGALDWCLEKGQWNFAMRSMKYEYSPSVEPPFGFRRAFNKPTDWIRTCAVCSDEFFRMPLLAYTDEAGFWFCDLDTIYVRYVSNDDSYGGSFALWPNTFQRVVSAYLAAEVGSKITQDAAKRLELKKALDTFLVDARSKDAMDEATQFAPPGTWTSSRRGRRTRWDRGFRSGNLY